VVARLDSDQPLAACIRIEMASLDTDAGRLKPLTVTAPVHVNRDPNFEYGTEY